MANLRIAERIMQTIDWTALQTADGAGDWVRQSLERLLKAEDGVEANRAYWGIENHAFVQGELFEISDSCTCVLVASLLDPRPDWVRVAVLELLFQILSGYASSAPNTPNDIVERCHKFAKDGLWLIVREALSGHEEGALEVLDLLGEGEIVRKLLGDPPHQS